MTGSPIPGIRIRVVFVRNPVSARIRSLATAITNGLTGAATVVRAASGRHAGPGGALVLAYHDVGRDRSGPTDYYVTPWRLRAQLVTARRLGLRFVDLEVLTERFLAGAPLDGLATVTFDDGLVGVYRHALPVLVDLGLPATVFAVSASLGATPPWWRGANRLMTRQELLEVAREGFRIASHTRTHPSLPSLGAADLHRELMDARHELEDLAQSSVTMVAYPFGHHDPRVRDAAVETGHKAGFTFLNGRIVDGLDAYRLPRLTMWSGQRLVRLSSHLDRPATSWPETQAEVVKGNGSQVPRI